MYHSLAGAHIRIGGRLQTRPPRPSGSAAAAVGDEGAAAGGRPLRAAVHKRALDVDAAFLARLDQQPRQVHEHQRVVGAQACLEDLLGLLQVLEGGVPFHVVELDLGELHEVQADVGMLGPVVVPAGGR